MLINYRHVNIFQEENHVLRDVTFHVDEGEFVYIIGKVGSGKSSLLKTFYCELDLHKEKEEETTAEVLGRNLYKMKRKEVPSLRKEMGIIFQDFQLLHDRTVRKNLEFVLRATGWKNKQDITHRIEEVLGEVGLMEKLDNMPHELSGGEQQRIAIARALLNQPKIIIADEPTGNLDMETAHHIVRLLKDITQTGTAVVMTTHNRSLLDQFPGIVYLCKENQISEVTKDYNHVDLCDDDGGADDEQQLSMDGETTEND